jgi:hypothetical protein
VRHANRKQRSSKGFAAAFNDDDDDAAAFKQMQPNRQRNMATDAHKAAV